MFKVADPDVVREKGFSLLDMKRYVQAVGMQAEGYKVDYAALADLRVPGIVLLSTRGYKHFVVLRKVSGDHVSIGDPALGNRVLTRRAFEREWNGIVFVVMGEGFDPSKPSQGFGKTFTIVDPGVSIKPFPSGILTHQSMDAMLKLVLDNDLKPEEVEAIRFYAGKNILEPIRYPLAVNHLWHVDHLHASCSFAIAVFITSIQ